MTDAPTPVADEDATAQLALVKRSETAKERRDALMAGAAAGASLGTIAPVAITALALAGPIITPLVLAAVGATMGGLFAKVLQDQKSPAPEKPSESPPNLNQ